jgi:hypothetical protein
MDPLKSSSSATPVQDPQPSTSSGSHPQMPTTVTLCPGSCRHVPPHRVDLPVYCAPRQLPTALKKEEVTEEDDDIVILHVRGRVFDEAVTRAHLLSSKRGRSLPPPDTNVSTDQQQLQPSTPPLSPKRSRATSSTSTTTASSPRLPAIDSPFDPARLTGYRLRLSLIPFGAGSEVYGSAVTSLDLGTMAATVVPPPRRLQQQQHQQGPPLLVRQDLFEETASAPGALDQEEDGGDGDGPPTF